MPWEPTTRGTKPTQDVCHYDSCKTPNTRLDYYIVDCHGNRYFCDSHWKWVCLFFSVVKDCKSCRKNHNAELYKDARTIDSVKYDGKWTDICLKHYRVLTKELCYLFSDEDSPFGY